MFGKMLALAGASAERSRMNYRDCLHCGFCATGCIYEKKNTMLQTYLPLAEKNGATVTPRAQVQRIEAIASGYRVHFLQDGAPQALEAKRVIVSGGGIHSAALLLRSAEGLPGLSDHVGRNFNNNGEHGYIGILPESFEGVRDYRAWMGMDNGGLMSFHWYDSHDFTLHPGAGLEPSLFAAAVAAANHPTLPARSWGLEYKRFVETVYPKRVIAFSVLGLDAGFWRITLKSDGTPDLVPGDRTASDAYLDRVDGVMEEITRKTGVVLVPATSRASFGTTSTHLLSANRMAESGADGVVDPTCQVFGHENLYVCDASVLPFSMAVNPALTIGAVAERSAEAIIARG
jgi:choline dehydrogenase-like flavoprotein